MSRTKVLLGLGASLALSLSAVAANNQAPPSTLSHATLFASGQVTRSISAPRYGFHEANPARLSAKPHFNGGTDSALHNYEPFGPEFNLITHELGVGNGFPGYTVPDAPPDTS